MKPFALSLFSSQDIELLRKIRQIIHYFPDEPDLGKSTAGEPIVLSCHILAYAIGNVLELEVETGYVHPHFDHSWIKTPKANIIDVYPVGVYPGPLLVERTPSFISPGRHWYQQDLNVWVRAVNKPPIQNAIALATKIITG